MESPREVFAALDVGSTSVHFLVADVNGGSLTPVHDESVFLGLGEVVRESRRLGEAKTVELSRLVARFSDQAAALGACQLVAVATEPLRRAADASRVVRSVERDAGVGIEVLTHDEEARLTVVGAASGRAIDGELVIVDIGGGSTEIVAWSRDGELLVTGVRIGAGSLTRETAGDPPTAEEIEDMRREARLVVADAPDASPSGMVAVGGTAEKVARIASPGSASLDVSRDAIEAILPELSATTAEALADRYALRPARARIVPAGAAILLAVMERYGVPVVTVSTAGLREGTVLVAAEAGIGWRDRLSAIVRDRLTGSVSAAAR